MRYRRLSPTTSKANGQEKGMSTGKKDRTQGEAFKRVKDEQWVGGLKQGFDDNTYAVGFRTRKIKRKTPKYFGNWIDLPPPSPHSCVICSKLPELVC